MYEFKIDLDGDTIEDLTYRFTCDERDTPGKQRYVVRSRVPKMQSNSPYRAGSNGCLMLSATNTCVRRIRTSPPRSYPVACLRYTAGETPTWRINQCDRWLCDENPDDNATSTTGMSVLRNSSLARSMRRASTY
jgi:hypothetical protein